MSRVWILASGTSTPWPTLVHEACVRSQACMTFHTRTLIFTGSSARSAAAHAEGQAGLWARMSWGDWHEGGVEKQTKLTRWGTKRWSVWGTRIYCIWVHVMPTVINEILLEDIHHSHHRIAEPRDVWGGCGWGSRWIGDFKWPLGVSKSMNVFAGTWCPATASHCFQDRLPVWTKLNCPGFKSSIGVLLNHFSSSIFPCFV